MQRKKFRLRLIGYIVCLILYGMIVYAATLFYEFGTEQQQAHLIRQLVFIPSIIIIIIFGEVTKVFDEEKKKWSKYKKIHFGLVLLWSIIFVSLLTYSFII